MLGLFGTLAFGIGALGKVGPDDIQRSLNNRIERHDLHLLVPKLEDAGPGLTEVSFKMIFLAPHTLNPTLAYILLEGMFKSRAPQILLFGLTPLSDSSRFVIEKMGQQWKYFYRMGGLMGLGVDVTLVESAANPLFPGLSSALGKVFPSSLNISPNIQAMGLIG